ncbi:MAG: hypothetical protein PHE55_01730 [Methylococcaceae bacterium]|nr:hypothetical protein [Methylococcaceae bacterium]
MAIRTRPPRTISDIKTHSGRTKREHQTYRDYFQVGALELERWRREREREAASRRIADIDSRIADIDREKRILLTEAGAIDSLAESKIKIGISEKKAPGFRIKY